MIDIVYYHANCTDGLVASWLIKRVYADALYIPCNYDIVPDFAVCRDKNVYIVDFSFRREVFVSLLTIAKRVTIMDHHKTAQEDLKDIECEVIFDMNKCGAEIVSDRFPLEHDNEFDNHWIIKCVADRDLWKWSLDWTETVGNILFRQGHFNDYESLTKLYESKAHYLSFITTEELEKIQTRKLQVLDIASRHEIKMFDSKYRVAVVSCPRHLRSDVGNQLCKEAIDFAILYYYNQPDNNYYISCRASKVDIDLTSILKCVNGGGHPHASGYTVSDYRERLTDEISL